MGKYLEKSKQYKGFHYSVLTENMINYLHNTGLKMLKEVQRIFDEIGVSYFAVGGTLLGAYKSHSFIPWDDDVDLCVFEEDYDRAIKELMKQLPSWILVQCKETEKKYFHGWVKIRDKNSKVFPDKDGYECSGVWIDIYKVRNVKFKEKEYVICKEHKDYLNRRYLSNGITKSEMRQRIRKSHLNSKLLLYKIKSILSINKRKVYMIWSASKVVIEKEWVFPLKKIKFEDTYVWSLNLPEKYLIHHYGKDYLNDPLDEQRRVGINKIVF